MRCPRCKAENASAGKFCGECGAPFDSSIGTPVSETGSVKRADLSGERRHLTVLFSDLVGSTAIAARLDPEQWREMVAGYHRVAAAAITRFDGHVAKYLGDGVMAYFGWPAAHDNDAERAARAGLALLDAIAKLNEQPGHAKLSARIGIDSGLVVIGQGAGNEAEVFGDVPNIASRVQSAAEPGTIAITDASHRLVSGLFVVEDCGAQELKGIERPLQLYRVVRPSGMRGRFPAMAATRGMTPFVGREDELRSLLHRWERVLEGDGQVVTIVGEAGIGKSRLVQHFREELAATPHTWLECATAPFFQNTPFYAVADMLQQSFHWEASHIIEQRLAALEASLGLAGLDPDEAVPLIAPLLELPVGTRYPPLSMAPDQQRKRLLATLVGWTFGVAKTQPLVIATEDLHWADPSTLELIQLMVEQGAHARLLLLYTARPEFHAPWPMRAHHTQLNLNRLTARNVRAMVAQVAARIALADETVATVVERTGGVPLFVEELTRAVLESGDAKLTGREIPATLHDSLMARLDRLGTAKEVIQVGAVIGSEFSYELLGAVHPIGEAELQAALRSLADAELLYVRGIAPDATYQFKHALIRDAAYEALLKSRRKELHLIVARTIDEQFPALKEAHPELLARHWSEAGETESAIREWQRAGERAVERRAYHEAERHYLEAIAILASLPESSGRDPNELKLQVALGVIMTAIRGYSSSETKEAYARARVLIERTGGRASLEILNGLRGAAVTRGELRASLGTADEILQIARTIGSPQALASAHMQQGNTRYYLGDLIGAREHFRLSLENYRQKDFPNAGNLIDPGIGSYVWAGANEWFLGYPDRAIRYTDDGLSLARRSNNPFNIATAFGFGTHVPSFRGDFKRVLETAAEAMKVSADFGFPIWSIIARIRNAWARALSGEVGGAVNCIREGLAEFDSLKFYLARALYLCLLSETQALAGEIDEATVSVEQALQENSEEVLYRPLVLTLRGELRLQSDHRGGACFENSEHDFHEAIRVARSISAKSLELRATMSLARMLKEQGRREEARTMLADIYGWFTEGFDTADLKDAKALLDQLGA
jgi:class 3 adenylate cyclase